MLQRRFLQIAVYFFVTRIILLNFASVIKLIIMRGTIRLMLMTLLVMSCSEDGIRTGHGVDYQYGRNLSHEKIVLGSRLENPYKTENITKALQELYPTKADRVEVRTTDLYVRFLPASDEEYGMLKELGLNLIDHPLDYEIVKEGDWYHDPEVPDGNATWQYAVVPPDFDFPDIEYEIIDECHISEHDSGTRADGIDWEAVERQAYMMTGNDGLLEPLTRAATKVKPSGRITIVDEHWNDGKPFGVAGIRVSCNSFVKFSHCYSDGQGYYEMPKSFASKLRYRLVFENEKGFSIGFNMVFVPASVSTMGSAGPEGVNMTVTKTSESKLYKRCVVNNAAYDYYTRCQPEDLNITQPPKDLRIWLFHKLRSGSSMMMHHGAVLDMDMVSSFLGDFSPLVKFFLPDITIGVENQNDYRTIYADVCHELAHASHFAKVGTSFWNRYILYVIGSYVASGGMTYGDGAGANSGYCELGEMWAFYLSSKMYHERYGGNYPSFGTTFWFYPQIFRYLEEKDISTWDIFHALDASTVSLDDLERNLVSGNPDKSALIEQIFDRYR